MELYLQLHILVIQAFVQMTEAHSFVWCTWLYCDFNNISINCAAILPFYINTLKMCHYHDRGLHPEDFDHSFMVPVKPTYCTAYTDQPQAQNGLEPLLVFPQTTQAPSWLVILL